MRRFVVVLAALAVMLGAAGAVRADVTDVGVEHVDDPTNRRVRIHGVIYCTAGETFSVRVSIWTDDGDKATGRSSGVCVEGDTHWVAKARIVMGSITCGEDYISRVRGRTATGQATRSFDHDFPICPFEGPVSI
ncbi:MAG: hypothetical protein HY658_09895 [Actinobacteria bacterium]|nr:hypothetical protein [Actinomycetota bacterium]